MPVRTTRLDDYYLWLTTRSSQGLLALWMTLVSLSLNPTARISFCFKMGVSVREVLVCLSVSHLTISGFTVQFVSIPYKKHKHTGRIDDKVTIIRDDITPAKTFDSLRASNLLFEHISQSRFPSQSVTHTSIQANPTVVLKMLAVF